MSSMSSGDVVHNPPEQMHSTPGPHAEAVYLSGPDESSHNYLERLDIGGGLCYRALAEVGSAVRSGARTGSSAHARGDVTARLGFLPTTFALSLHTPSLKLLPSPRLRRTSWST